MAAVSYDTSKLNTFEVKNFPVRITRASFFYIELLA